MPTKVTATALTDLTVDIDGQPATLSVGERHELVILGAVELGVAGQFAVRIEAGTGAAELAERLEHAQATLRSVCEEGQVDDLAQARQIAAARSDALRVLADTETSIAQDRRDLTVASLAQKVEGLTRRIGHYEASRPPVPPVPADLDRAQALVHTTNAALEAARQESNRRESDLASASSAVRGSRSATPPTRPASTRHSRPNGR